MRPFVDKFEDAKEDTKRNSKRRKVKQPWASDFIGKLPRHLAPGTNHQSTRGYGGGYPGYKHNENERTGNIRKQYSGPCYTCFRSDGRMWMLRAYGNKSITKNKGMRRQVKYYMDSIPETYIETSNDD